MWQPFLKQTTRFYSRTHVSRTYRRVLSRGVIPNSSAQLFPTPDIKLTSRRNYLFATTRRNYRFGQEANRELLAFKATQKAIPSPNRKCPKRNLKTHEIYRWQMRCLETSQQSRKNENGRLHKEQLLPIDPFLRNHYTHPKSESYIQVQCIPIHHWLTYSFTSAKHNPTRLSYLISSSVNNNFLSSCRSSLDSIRLLNPGASEDSNPAKLSLFYKFRRNKRLLLLLSRGDWRCSEADRLRIGPWEGFAGGWVNNQLFRGPQH